MENRVTYKKYQAALQRYIEIILTLPEDARNTLITMNGYEAFLPYKKMEKYHGNGSYTVSEQTAQRIEMLLNNENANTIVKMWIMQRLP